MIRLELPRSGTYECERCRARFDVLLGSPRSQPRRPAVPGWAVPPGAAPAPASPVPAPVDLARSAPCAAHPLNAATATCERCGDFMCPLCSTRIEGREYCPRCFELLYRRGSLELTQRSFTLPGATLALGLFALLCAALAITCVGLLVSIPLSIAGIVTGARALREHRERPDLPGRRLTYAGLTMAALSIPIGIGEIALFVWFLSRM